MKRIKAMTKNEMIKELETEHGVLFSSKDNIKEIRQCLISCRGEI